MQYHASSSKENGILLTDMTRKQTTDMNTQFPLNQSILLDFSLTSLLNLNQSNRPRYYEHFFYKISRT